MKLFDENLNWYKGNMHTHTTISDGARAPEDVIEIYRAAGYNFLAITDHRKMSYPHMDGDMLLIGGAEFDYMLENQCIHIVGVGMDCEPELEPTMCGRSAQQAIDGINSVGGIAILAHPSWSLNTLDAIMPLTGLSGVEIYNSTSGTPWNAARADASQFIDLMYARKNYIPVVSSDDSHSYTGEQTRSFTYVNAPELAPESIKSAIRSGAMYASQGPRFIQIEITDGRVIVDCSPIKRAIFFSDALYTKNRTVEGDSLTHIEYKLTPSENYIRVQLDDGFGNSAWSRGIALK